jgi:hypothetical protein
MIASRINRSTGVTTMANSNTLNFSDLRAEWIDGFGFMPSFRRERLKRLAQQHYLKRNPHFDPLKVAELEVFPYRRAPGCR